MSGDSLGLAGAQARRALLIGTVIAFASAALYGANIPAARVASQSGMPGADLIAWRALILIPLLLVLAPLFKERLMPERAQWSGLARLGIAASFTATFYLSAVDLLPVPMAVTLFYTFPLLVMVLSIVLERRWPARIEIGVFVAAFAGLVMAVGPSFAGLKPVGIVFALLGAVACALMFIFAGRVSPSPLRNTFWTQIAMLPISCAFAWWNGGPAPVSVFAIAPFAIALAMAGYALGYVFQMMASSRLAPSRISLIFLFEPVVAITVAWLFLGETLGLIQVVGVGLILAALAVEVIAGARRGAA